MHDRYFYILVLFLVATDVAACEAQGKTLIRPPPARPLRQCADSRKQGLNIETHSNIEIDISDEIFQFI